MTERQAERTKQFLEQRIFNFAFVKMHLPLHVTRKIRSMGSPDNFTTDISERLHIEHAKKAYRATNRVDYVTQMLYYNDRQLSLKYMDATLKHLALQGIVFPFDEISEDQPGCSRSVQVRNERQSNRPLSVRVRNENENENELQVPRLAGPVPKLKITLLQAQKMFGIPDLARHFKDRIIEEWKADLFHSICGSDTEYPQRVRIKVYNSAVYFYQPYQQPLDVKKQLLRCRPNDRSKNHAIWTRVTEDTTSDTFQGRKVAISLLYFGYTPLESALYISGSSDKVICHTAQRKRNGETVNLPKPRELQFAMITGTKYVTSTGQPDSIHGCVEVIENPQDRYVMPIRSLEGAVHLVPVDEVHKGPNPRQYLVNNHIDLDTYYYVY